MALEKVYLKLGDNLLLNDGKVYSIQNASMPPPPLARQMGGANIFRDGEEFIASRYANRVITLTLLIQGTSEADLRDNIRALYAEVYAEDTNVLEYRSLGSSTSLYFDTFRGEMDVAASPDGMWAARLAENVLVTLPAKPFARGAEVRLKNLCRNASLDRDANGDGTPDYWNLAGTATLSLDTAHRKYGIRSVKIVGAAANDSVYSNAITITASTAYAASFQTWVRTGTLEIRVAGNNSGELASITTTADKWNRGTLTFTTGAADATIYIEFRQSGTTNVDAFVDGVYIGQHATAPAGWCAYRGLVNHTDDDAGDVSYFDVADIPGDVPATCAFGIDDADASGTIRTSIWGVVEGSYALLFDHIYEAEDISGIGGTTEVDATASGGECQRLTTGSGFDVPVIPAGGTLEQLETYRGRYYVYARVRANADGQYFGIKIRAKTGNWWPDWQEQVTELSMNSWGLVKLGTADFPPLDMPDGYPSYTMFVAVYVTEITDGGSLDIDYFWLVPRDAMGITYFEGYTLANIFFVDTISERAVAQVRVLLPEYARTAATPLEGLRYTGHYHFLKPNSRARFMVNASRRKFLDYGNESDRDTHNDLYTTNDNEYWAQGIKAATTCTPKVIWLYMRATASPTDNATLEIQPEVAGDPSGAEIADGESDAVDMSSISTTDWEWVPFVFSTAPTLTAGTQYWLVLKSDQGAADATNYIMWGEDTVGHYDDGHSAVYDGAAWTHSAGSDALFKADIGYNKIDEVFRAYLHYVPRYLLVP